MSVCVNSLVTLAGFSILSLLPAPHSGPAMPSATPPPFPHIFCLYFYRTNKMDLCPSGAGNICTATALAPNPRSCFCASLHRGLAEAGAEQPGAAGLLHEIFRKLFAWRDKSPCQQPGALQRRLSHGGHQPKELHPSQLHNELFTGLGCLRGEPRRAEEEERQTQCERDALGGRLGFSSSPGVSAPWKQRGLKRE